MKLTNNFNLINMDLTNTLNPKDVWIEFFVPDREIIIDGLLIEGYLKNNKVLLVDKLCLRYSWLFKESVDVEVYSKGRHAWYKLTIPQFNAIKYYISEQLC